MESLFIKDFRFGLDTRKSELTQRPGTLEVLNNGFINQGGEIQNRKAFVRTARVAGTFGLQSTATGLITFGSSDLAGVHPVNIGTVGIPINVNYQRLQHPAVLYNAALYDVNKHAMTQVIYSASAKGKAFAIAKFADGKQFCYYDGVLVNDVVSGVILEYLAGDNRRIADHMKSQVNLVNGYTSVRVGPYAVTAREHAVLVATLTIGAHDCKVGDKVWVSGINASYNVIAAPIIAITATQISYNTAVNLTEGPIVASLGTVETAVLTVNGGIGTDFSILAENTTVAGTMAGPLNTVSPVATVIGASAKGSFVISGGSPNLAVPGSAVGILTSTATNAVAGEYVQIGKKKYTFRIAANLTSEGDVLIGANAAASLLNLQRAITHTGTPGTDYISLWAHPMVKSAVIGGLNLTITAYAGSQGASVVTTTTSATWTWGAATLSAAGVGSCVGSVKVVSTTGVETELLGGPVAYLVNNAATAAAVRDAIIAYSGTSGYTAEVNGNRVTVVSSDTAAPMPNDYHLQIACGGDVIIGESSFYLTQQAASFTLNSIIIDGLDLFANAGGAPATNPQIFPAPPVDTFPEYYVSLVQIINARSGIHGINAWTDGSYVKLSKVTTRDDDSPLTIYITPALPNTVGIVFNNPPQLNIPLTVTLPDSVIAPAVDGIFTLQASPNSTTANIVSAAIIPVITGGNGLFTFEWIEEYPGTSGTFPYAVGIYNIGIYRISAIPTTSRATNATLVVGPLGPLGAAMQYNLPAITARNVFRLRVTDSFGNVALSNPCTVELQTF